MPTSIGSSLNLVAGYRIAVFSFVADAHEFRFSQLFESLDDFRYKIGQLQSPRCCYLLVNVFQNPFQ